MGFLKNCMKKARKAVRLLVHGFGEKLGPASMIFLGTHTVPASVHGDARHPRLSKFARSAAGTRLAGTQKASSPSKPHSSNVFGPWVGPGSQYPLVQAPVPMPVRG